MSSETEVLATRRVRLGLWIAMSFVAVLASIGANDALVQAGQARSTLRVAALGCLLVAGLALIVSLLRFLALLRRSQREPDLRRELWDELATANHQQSMVVAYLAMLFVLVVLAVVSMFASLSAPWVVNAILVTAFLSQAISFSLFERRGAR